jgi:hypothetical protein
MLYTSSRIITHGYIVWLITAARGQPPSRNNYRPYSLRQKQTTSMHHAKKYAVRETWILDPGARWGQWSTICYDRFPFRNKDLWTLQPGSESLFPTHTSSLNNLCQRFLTFWLLWTPLNHYWKPRTPKPFLRFEPQKNTQRVHNKQIHKSWNILFNSQTKKYTKNRILISMGRLTNLIFNLQFKIPSLGHRTSLGCAPHLPSSDMVFVICVYLTMMCLVHKTLQDYEQWLGKDERNGCDLTV